MDADLGAEMGADAAVDLDVDMEEPSLDLPPIPDLDDEEDGPLASAGRPKR
jgi:hypothetical protein